MRATTRGTNGSHRFTIGGTAGTSKSKDRKGMKSNFEVDETEQGHWTRLDEADNGSDKGSTVPIRGIRKDTTVEVEMSSLHSNNQGPRAGF